MNIRYNYLLTIILSYFFSSCQAQINMADLKLAEGQTIIISSLVDMQGDTVSIPKDVILKFEDNGSLYNGTIVGNYTQISVTTNNIFDNVTIGGTWNVGYICTDMFKDMLKENSLKNVMALSSSRVKNVITIGQGTYKLSAIKRHSTVLKIPSNTEVILNGTVCLAPNDLDSYNIFQLEGDNIKFHGNGRIIGDKQTHLGKTGEWGMGINLQKCNNASISDITIMNCWGDCIYVGGNSNNININNCILDNGRRQGISITSAGSVIIENCTISNVSGTAPQSAIDVEPNKGNIVENVTIRNVTSNNCIQGFIAYGGSKNASIHNIDYFNCYVSKSQKGHCYAFNVVDSVKLHNCYSDSKEKPSFQNCKISQNEK